MAIRDEVQPKQRVQCDLCGTEFERKLVGGFTYSGSGWEEVSIWISPHLKNSGGITIEHACLDCREEFVTKARELIDEMRKELKNG